MRITKVFECVYDQHVGWNPVSGSIKPVHIANGLFRDLMKMYFDTSEIVALMVPGKRNNAPDENRTFEKIVMDSDDPRFEVFQGSKKEG